jgi:hypothetical protein
VSELDQWFLTPLLSLENIRLQDATPFFSTPFFLVHVRKWCRKAWRLLEVSEDETWPAVFQFLYYAAFRIALRSDAGTVMGKKRLLG